MSVGEILFLLCTFRPIRVKPTTSGKLALSLMRVSGRAFLVMALGLAHSPAERLFLRIVFLYFLERDGSIVNLFYANVIIPWVRHVLIV